MINEQISESAIKYKIVLCIDGKWRVIITSPDSKEEVLEYN